MLQAIPLVGGHGPGSMPDFDAQITENMYVETGAPGSKSPAALVSRPGSVRRGASVSGIRVAALHTTPRGDRMMAFVQGAAQPLRMYVGATPDPTAFGPAYAGSDLHQKINIASDENGDLWAVSFGRVAQFMAFVNGSTLVVTASTYVARDVVHLDHRFVFIDNADGSLRHTNLNSTVIDPLNVLQPGVQAIALGAVGRELWVFGTDGTEVYYNDGSAGFAYTRQDGASIDVGLHSANAVATLDGTLYFVARSDEGRLRVVRVNGYQLEAISTPFIDRLINERHSFESFSCDAFGCTNSGHSFLVLRFRSYVENRSFSLCFDTGTNHWFTINYSIPGDDVPLAYDGICSARLEPFTHIGSATGGDVFTLTESLPTDDGRPFRKRVRIGRVTSPTAAKHISLELRAKTGEFANADTPDPKVMLRWSDDGARTFGEERVASLGEVGEYVKRVAFRRLGMSRDRVYEITIADSMNVTLLEVLADIEATRT